MRDFWRNGLIADLEFFKKQKQPKEISQCEKPTPPAPSRLT
jgi:hypothetical protein